MIRAGKSCFFSSGQGCLRRQGVMGNGQKNGRSHSAHFSLLNRHLHWLLLP
jgi:hypothetical protein